MDSVDKNITIRKLELNDSEAINEIYHLITKTDPKNDITKIVQEHVQNERHEAHFVTVLNGKVVGFMISYFLPLGFGAEKSAYIATMGVHPQYMGTGIGLCMVKEIFKFYSSKGVTQVYTSVKWDSTDLLSFCKTIGFEGSNYISLRKRLN